GNTPSWPACGDHDTSTLDTGDQGRTSALLKSKYDQAFPAAVWIFGQTGAPAATGAGAVAPTAPDYCVISQNGSWYAWKHGPGGTISVATSLASVCASTDSTVAHLLLHIQGRAFGRRV